MSSEEIIVSAPGSLMLMGEHAVLRGRRALVAAINRRVRVRVRPRDDRQVRIRSELGKLDTALDHLTVRPPFTFVLATLLHHRRRLTHGLDITIESEFSHKIGFGSSAAITVALLKALDVLRGGGFGEAALPKNPAGRARSPNAPLKSVTGRALLQDAIAVIRSVQGVGSGADAAASICGGIVLYRATPLVIRPLAGALRLTTVYSGHKTPTAEVIQRVEKTRRTHPALFNGLFDLMDDCVARALPFIQAQRWDKFGELMDIHHGLQVALGVNTPALEEICHRLRKSPGIAGAKISGSGLGDCAIGLGHTRTKFVGYPTQQLRVELHGARLEKA
ncbi:MAG: galactokinase family protein [Gallionellaceae bacterium]|jgi:mevalonate kinase